MSIYDIFILLGGVGLFLYGMTIMSSGLKNACGDNLKVILGKATKNKVTSILAGIAVTIFVQSSSATDVMVIGFVTSGLMTLSQAIGVIMGANIGTTVTAQITAFNIGAYAPMILFLGAVMNLFLKNRTLKEVGSVILGFGMLFQGITLMKSAIAPLAETAAFRALLTSLENPILTVLFGIAFTALLQSSSSATVIFQAFAVQNIISYQTAVYLVIGAAVGSVMPNLLAGLTANRNGKRCAVLNLLFNSLRAILILVLITVFPQILTFIQNLSPGNVARQIANTHTCFAILAVLVLAPVSEFIVKLAGKLIPPSEEETRRGEDQRLVYLNNTSQIPAVIAMDQAHREICRMAHFAIDNLQYSIDCFFEHDAKKGQMAVQGEETVDYLTGAILGKLVELRSLDLSPKHLNKLYRYIQVVDDLERISDHAENIVEYEELMRTGKASMHQEALDDLQMLANITMQSMNVSLIVFEQELMDRFDDAEAMEDLVDQTKEQIEAAHIERMAK
ncbi:MAG: Na/Pi cotransporter family protein [Lachnospiraceae bacterium]